MLGSFASKPLLGVAVIPTPTGIVYEIDIVTATTNVHTIPMTCFNATIDWGDGTIETGVSGGPGISHTYPAVDGTYTITITNQCDVFAFGGGSVSASQVKAIIAYEDLGVATMLGTWRGCSDAANDISSFDFAGMVSVNGSMTRAFEGCSLITGTPDASTMSGVTDMTSLFSACVSLTGVPDFTLIPTVTTLRDTFDGCVSITGTPDFSALTACTTIRTAFDDCAITGVMDISGMSSLTFAGFAFRNCSGVTGIISGGLSNVTNWTDTITGTSCSAASIDQWLIDLDNNSAVVASIRYQGLTGNTHLDSARSVAGLAAKNSLIGKGWVFSGVY